MKNPNGYGTIGKLPGKRRKPWYVKVSAKYTSDGDKLKVDRPYLGYYTTRAEAMQALADYHRNPYQLSEKPTFAEIYEKWYPKKIDGLSDNRIRAINIAYDKCREIHDIPVIDLKLENFQQIVDRYENQSCTAVRSIKSVIVGVCGYAMQRDLIPKDYSKYITIKSAEKASEIHKVFTIEEINDLWNAPQSVLRDITLILLYSGWRIGELLDLDTLDLENQIMIGGKKTKAGKGRIVPIHHRIFPLIEQYKDGFPLPYETIRRKMKVQYSHLPHDTRHTFISRLQSLGGNKVCIERIVGHASKSITDSVYTHKEVDELRATIELLD